MPEVAKFTIFGARGWIGSALVQWLGMRGHEVRALTRDDWPADGERLGHVVYAIGLTADFRNRPLATAQAHVGVLLQVLERFRYDSFLYLSTTRVYLNAHEAVEDAVLSVSPTNPDDVYNATKLAGEAVCLSLPQPTVRIARLSNVIGPNDRSDNFLATVIGEARSGEVLIRTSPDSEKDYVALSDVVSMIEAIALGGRHRLYNVASGHNVSDQTIADLVRRHIGARVSFMPHAPRVVFPPIVIDRIWTEFNARPQPFETAFAEVVNDSVQAVTPFTTIYEKDGKVEGRPIAQRDMIPVFKPLIEQEEIDAARNALQLGWLGMGTYVGMFEQQLKDFLGAEHRHVVAVSTGHAALHLGLLLAGVGPGDEVITASFNNAADFQAILACGAAPVFCDIDEDSLCIDLDIAERLVSPRTKAIIVMDYDCILCDHDRVAEFSRRHRLRVIHDAAHSFGSKYKGQRVGSFSDIATFSFDPVKAITCIDGGALVVRSEDEVRRLHEMRLIGMSQSAKVMYQNTRAWTYDVSSIGFRYHLANLHAAIGLAQLAKIDRIMESRHAACRYYNERLKEIPAVIVPKTDFVDITPFLYYIRVPEDRRDPLRKLLRDNGIDTGIHWPPGHHFTMLKDCRRGDLSVTERVSNSILSLPLHSCMSTKTLDRVIDGITSLFA